MIGSFVTRRLSGPLGVYQLLLVAAGILALSLLITNVVDSRERGRAAERAAARAAEADEPIGKEGAFRLVLGNRYLLWIALLILFLNWVNTNGGYILDRTVERAADEAMASGTLNGLSGEEYKKQYFGKFYADFYLVVNWVGLVVQLFLVSRIFKYLGVRVAILFLPVIALGGYALLAFYPVLGAVRWAKTAENATDYSLYNTVRQVLFLPTTRQQKYKAKQAIDTFFVRAGDVLSAALIFAGTTWFSFGTRQFALVNLGFVLVWIVLAVLIGRENRRLTA